MSLLSAGVAGHGVVLEATVVVVAVEDPEGSITATVELTTDHALVFGKGTEVVDRDRSQGHLDQIVVLALRVGGRSLELVSRNSRYGFTEAGQGHGPDPIFAMGALGALGAGHDRVGQAMLGIPGAVHVGLGHGVVLADGALGVSQSAGVDLDFQHGLESAFEFLLERGHDRDS